MNILAGHLLGDILLQNKWLAKIKISKWYGMLLHCLIATFGMWLFTQWGFKQLLLVFASHFVIDHFGIGKKLWPDFIKQGKFDSNEGAPDWLRLLDDQAFHLICYWFIGGLK